MRTVDIINRDGTFDTINAYTVDDFPWNELPKIALNCKHRKGKQICNTFATFDIETSTYISGYRENAAPIYSAFMYHWQMCIGGTAIYGRIWPEWLQTLDKLIDTLEINCDRQCIIYVHNLGYEFQFMIDFLVEHYHCNVKIFAAQPRKPIYISLENGLVFRCTWKLSNMSLEKATLNEKGVRHIKAAGDLDYKIMRTPDSKLDDKEFGYSISDVVSLYEYVQCKMRNEYDNLDTIPLTSTGYVRRDCRRSCRKDLSYRKDVFAKLSLSADVYRMLKQAGRGGDTHANRRLSNRIIHNVDSYDVSSSYPFQLLAHKYPMTKFEPYGEVESLSELDKLLNGHACLFTITITNVCLRTEYAFPYIPTAKVLQYDRKTAKYDNGRILRTAWLQMSVTDIDFKLIRQQYTYSEIYISDMYIADYDYLPEPICAVIRDYFYRKSELKMRIKSAETPEEIENCEYLYAKSKNRLNGIFGMMYTDPIHDEIVWDADAETSPWRASHNSDPAAVGQQLNKYFKSRNSFLYYPWGVWCTAYARTWLANMVNTIGQDLSVYCDTDSDKCIHDEDGAERINLINKEIEKIAEDRRAYADVTDKCGISHRFYMGTYERETKVPYTAFKTMGAKKYCYEDNEGLHITVAGVNKKEGAKELGSIDNFTEGFVWHDAGGVELHYNDNVGIHEIEIDGCRFETASNVAIVDSTYTLGLGADYAELLSDFMDAL